MFDPNPEAQTRVAFDVIQPGTYRMRVKEVSSTKEDGSERVSEKGNKTFRVTLEYVDPSALSKLGGGQAENVGTVFDYVVYEGPGDPKQVQGKLRSLVEACGQAWGQLNDEQMLIGSELDVKIKLDEYMGEQNNKVARYLAPASV